jgi:hypothetical protein
MSTNSRERKRQKEYQRGYIAGLENRNAQPGESMDWKHKSAAYADGRARGTAERLARKVSE